MPVLQATRPMAFTIADLELIADSLRSRIRFAPVPGDTWATEIELLNRITQRLVELKQDLAAEA